MAHWLEVRKVKEDKVLIRLNGYVEWWVEPGEAVKVSDPEIGVYRIDTDPNGRSYQGPINLPSSVSKVPE